MESPGGAEHNSAEMGPAPKNVPSHGSSGYKRGCRCFTCRRGHAKDQNEYNRRKADRTLSVKSSDTAGMMERSVAERINDLGVRGTEAAMLIELARASAKAIDGIIADNRPHLLASAQRNLLEVMDRLSGLGKPAKSPEPGDGGDGDDFLRSLGTPES